MQAFGRLSSYISQGVYTVSAPFHPFGGAVDIIVVQQQDGSLKSSPWYVQFGKFQGVLKTQEKVVKILVNEADAGLHMYLDHKGEAFFLKESDNGAIDGPIVSPLTSEDETDEGPQMRKSQMLDFESNQTESVSKIDVENGKIVARTNSRRSRIFGFFGRRSMREDSGQDQVSIKRLNSLESAERAADLLEMKWSTNLPATRITDRSLPRPPSRKDDNEETGMNIVEKGSLSSGKDPDSCNQGRNLPQSPSKKDDGKEFNMNIDKKRSLSSGEDPHPCTQGNRSVSDADLANMEHSSPVDTAEGSQCIEPQEEEDATSTSVCPVVYNSETSASVDSDENITDMPVSVLEKSDRGAVSDGHTVETVVESKGITSPRDTAHENYDETLKGPLSSDYAVETVISDGKTKLPQDALLENSDQPLKGPLVIANNEEKTSLVDTVPDKFQAFEVPSRPSNHTVQTVILNSMENASDDGNADVSGFRDADLNLKLSVQEKGDIGVSSCVLYETETYGTSTVTLDFINGELQSSGPTRERNELVRVNDPEIYGTANFAPEVNLTQPVTSVSVNHLVDHYSPCIGISNHYGDTTNLKQDAFQNLTESDKTKSSDSESKKPETQFPSDMDVESYESIVKILQENVVHMENEEKEDETVSDTIFENQVQCEGGETNTSTSDTIGSETLQHASCSLDVESKNTTLVSIAKTNNSVQNIFEEVAIGEVDNSVEHVSVRDCGPDNCSKSDLLVSADYEMPNSSEGGWFIARNIDKIANDGPPPQQLIADVNIEENLPRARMKDQDSRLTSVDDTKLSDDCYDESINQSSDIRPLTVANYIESNAFVQSTLSGVSSDIINSNDLDDSYSVSYFNQLSTNKTNIDENEACTSSGLEEGSIRKQVDQTSNASAADPDTCNIVEATKVPKVAVEVSLCRHLLFEGMGEEAASEAFEAEKLNLEKFASAGPVIVKNSKLIVKIGRHYFPWEAATPIILGLSSFDKDDIFEPEGAIPVKKIKRSAEQDSSKSVTRSGTWKIWPFGSTKSKEKGSEDRSPDGHKEIGTTIGSDDVLSDIKNMSNPKDTKKKVYSRIPSTEQLASLNLKEGQNSVTFSFETAMLGRQQVDARIYLWKWNAHIVISDVDGTITKSDVLGQFMPLVGKDWSQTGVAHLFSAIKENGYQFIFLSARSISQAYITRQFLFNLKQDGKALPDGPVVISPDGLFPSLYREVIRRAPHEFKISCLEDIKALFPPDCNPFYAGFGNRHTDEISYVKVGVPKGKIFTINPRGEIVVNRTVDAKSYVSLHALVDAMFPPTNSSEQEEFNSWNFWKPSLPDIKI